MGRGGEGWGPGKVGERWRRGGDGEDFLMDFEERLGQKVECSEGGLEIGGVAEEGQRDAKDGVAG